MKINRDVCTHMEKYMGDAEYLVKDLDQPWNGWLVFENGHHEYETGLYYDILMHLINCKEIDEKTKEKIRNELKEINRIYKTFRK